VSCVLTLSVTCHVFPMHQFQQQSDVVDDITAITVQFIPHNMACQHDHHVDNSIA